MKPHLNKARLKKIGLFTAELVGICLGVSLLLIGFILWRADRGAVDLNMFRSGVEQTFSKALPEGYSIDIAAITFQSSKDRPEDYQLIVRDVTIIPGAQITNPAGKNPNDEDSQSAADPTPKLLKASSPAIIISLPKRRLLTFRSTISDIVINDPLIHLVEGSSSGSGEVPVSSIEEKNQESSPSKDDSARKKGHNRKQFEKFINSARFRDHLRSAQINNMRIDYSSQSDQILWRAHGGSFLLKKEQGTNFQVQMSSLFSRADNQSNFTLRADYDDAEKTAALFVSGDEFPIGDIASLLGAAQASAFTPTLSGSADLSVDLDGIILGADFNLKAGKGDLRIKEQILPVRTLIATGELNRQNNAIKLTDFRFDIGDSKGSITGEIGFADSKSGDAKISQDHDDHDLPGARAIAFDFASNGLELDTLGFLSEILSIQNLAIKGELEPAQRRLTLSALDFVTDGLGIKGDIQVHLPKGKEGAPDPSFGLKANLKTSGKISVQRLMALWTDSVAPGSRLWVKNHVQKGYIHNLDFNMDLPAGLRGEIGYIPNENLVLHFDIGEADSEFIYKVTPLKNAYGHGLLKGNSLLVDIEKGQMGTISVENGVVHFPHFHSSESKHIYKFVANGNAQEMLTILDGEAFRLISRAGLDPLKINGQAVARMEIIRTASKDKTTRRRLDYDGIIDFENLSFSDIFRDSDLENGRGQIILKSREMDIIGNGYLGQKLVDVEWNQKFYSEDGPSSFTVSGVFDPSLGDEIGIATRSFLRGPVDFILRAVGDHRKLDSFEIDADFTKAQLGFERFGINKKINATALGKIEAGILNGGANVKSFSLIGEGIDILGAFSLAASGRLENMNFSKFFIDGRTNFSVKANRLSDGVFNINLDGSYLDLGPAILSTLGARSGVSGQGEAGDDGTAPFSWGDGVRANMKLDRLTLRNDVEINNASLDFFHDRDQLKILELSGRGEQLDLLDVKLSEKEKLSEIGVTSLNRVIEVNIENLGDLLSGIFGVTSVSGGQGVLNLDLGAIAGAPIIGTARAQDFRIIEAPFLARLFAAGSLDGLSDLLNNQGIELTEAGTDFTVEDNILHFNKSKVIGPSIGITANGRVHVSGRGNVALRGAMAPAYQVNSILGNTPLIGGLFVNRDGEGVVAMTYDVTGNVSAPTVKINPFMALAPGVLRRAFENSDADFEAEFAKELENEVERELAGQE